MSRPRHELQAEVVREVGCLLLVFAPLETLIRSEKATSFDWLITSSLAVFGFILILVGIGLEAE
jgi:hypothetical protein